MKKGKYTVYKGREYRVIRPEGMYVTLISDDEMELVNGFETYDQEEKIYTKKVRKDELEDFYNLTSSAIYKGYKFLILAENKKKGTYTLSGGEEEAKIFPMECIDRYEFMMKVPKEEVELIIEKEPRDLDKF